MTDEKSKTSTDESSADKNDVNLDNKAASSTENDLIKPESVNQSEVLGSTSASNLDKDVNVSQASATAPESTTPLNTPQAEDVSRKRKSKATAPVFLWVLTFLSFAVALGAIGISAFLYQTQQKWASEVMSKQGSQVEQYSQLDKRLDQVKSSIGSLDGNVQQQTSRVNRELKTATDQLKYNTRKLAEIPGATREDWKIAEAEYMLRLANQRLLMERDSAGASALLGAADEVLLGIGNPALFKVREQINRDRAKVDMVQHFDREGVFLRLTGVIEQVKNLPWLPELDKLQSMGMKEEPSQPVLKAKVADEAAPENQMGDDDWSQKLGSLLKPFVRFERRDSIVEPLLTPDQHYYLQQNLRLMLEQAQLAVVKEEPKLYATSLQKAQAWIKEYFPLHKDPVAKMLDIIAELERVDVKPSLPDITGSIQSLVDFVDESFPKPVLDKKADGGNA